VLALALRVLQAGPACPRSMQWSMPPWSATPSFQRVAAQQKHRWPWPVDSCWSVMQVRSVTCCVCALYCSCSQATGQGLDGSRARIQERGATASQVCTALKTLVSMVMHMTVSVTEWLTAVCSAAMVGFFVLALLRCSWSLQLNICAC
jgi:hypothetical protein